MIASIRNSLSGMKLSAKSVAVSASNVANARNTASLDGLAVTGVSGAKAGGSFDESPRDPLYVPQRVEGEAVAGGGVRAVLRDMEPAYVIAFDPDNPQADQDGLVARPNVNIAEEMVRNSQARSHFEANLKVLRTADDMLGTLLDDKA